MIIGIDIGGTHFRIGAVDENGDVQAFRKIPTKEIIRSEDVLSDIADFLKEYSAGMYVEAVSIGFPATLDRERKTVIQAPNLKFMENLPVVSVLSDKLDLPVFAERDVTMALCYDTAKYCISSEGICCGIYFGTGIGNAISINGLPLTGKSGTAGELGHIPMDGSVEVCGCGNIGCMENLAGGKYLARLQIEKYPDTAIEDMFMKYGDEPFILQFVDRMAMSVATEINILDPDYVLIGGGIPNMKNFPKEYLHMRILAHTRKPYPAENLDIIYADDEPEKSVVGAAYYAESRKIE